MLLRGIVSLAFVFDWAVRPLILGNDVRNMSADDLAVVSNRDAIAVNQAWAGFAGDMLNHSQYPPTNASRRNTTQLPSLSVWWKSLPNHSAAAVLWAPELWSGTHTHTQ